MPLQIPLTLRPTDGGFVSPELSAEERFRRRYLALCFLIMTPALAGYGVVDLVQGRPSEALATFALVVVLATTFALMPRWRKIWALFRVAVAFAVAVLTSVMARGGGDGVVFLWFYTLPLVVFFLFGKREGATWAGACWVLLLVLFFGPFGLHAYEPAAGLRFMITYGVVSVLAYALEASRHWYHGAMLAEKAALEDTLAQVKTLRGLLPICTSCKSVRDDRGYWNQIETYVGERSQAEFSLGLCPRCRAAEPSADPVRDHAQG